MYINKKGKNQPNEEASRLDNSSSYSEPNNTGNKMRVGGNQQLGRSPIIQTKRDLDKSTSENGPEIMYIDNDQNDRRNPMMDYSNGRKTGTNFSQGGQFAAQEQTANADFASNYRNSVLTNVRNEVETTNKQGNKIVNKAIIPLNFDPEREKSQKVINLEEQNTRTLNQKRVNTNSYNNLDKGGLNNNNNNNSSQSSQVNTNKSEANQTYISDTNKQRRNLNANGSGGIVKKMSPNRNNDMNIDLGVQRDVNKISALKKLSIFSEKNNPNNMRQSTVIKAEFSVDTRDHLNSKYTNDLDKIMKYNRKQENFKKYNSNALIANNPKEGRLYTTQTHTFSPVQKELEEHKQAIKNMTKLSTIMLKEKLPINNNNFSTSSANRNGQGTVRSSSNEFQEKTTRRNLANSSSPSGGKFIRVTMALLSSKGPNCEDRIITRQMRFEKGGVVDLAQPVLKNNNRSAPRKQIEVKKTNLRSPRPIRANQARFTQKEEKAAKVVQSWWRDILSKYKDVVNKTVTIQKTWRRYFIRKNLYYKLSAFYFYSYLFDKIENLIKRHNILLGYEQLYNQNAEKYNAIKYLRNVIFLQRAYRFYRNLKSQKFNNSKIVPASNVKTSLRKAVKIPKGKAYENQNNHSLTEPNNQNQNNKNQKSNLDDNADNNTTNKQNKKQKTNYRYGDEVYEDENDVNNVQLQKKLDGKLNKKIISGNDDENNDLVSTSSIKEKALTQQLQNLRNRFVTSAIGNIIKKNNKRNLTPFVLQWIKNAAMGSNKTDAGRKLAAADIAKAIIKRKFDLLLTNLRKAGEKPNKTFALNRIANNLLGLFNNRKRFVFSNLKRNVPGIKSNINDKFVSKILGMHLKKTSAKIQNRKLADKFKYWRDALRIKFMKTNLVNAIPSDDITINKNKGKNTISNKEEDKDDTLNLVSNNSALRQKTLKSLMTNLQAKFRNINLPHLFNLWRHALNIERLNNLRDKIMQRSVTSIDKRIKLRSLARRFAFWSAKARLNRTVDAQVSLSAAQNQKLSAASKLAPALKNLLRSFAAKASKDAIVALLKKKNRSASLLKTIRFKPFFEKFNLQKYFDKFKNNVTEKEKVQLESLLLKTYCRKLIQKSTVELLKKRLNQWWRSLPQTNTRVRGLNAVDKLKHALQKRYFQHPKDALKEKIEAGNVDWALMFIVEFKKKFLKRSVREYVVRWRNNYLGEMVNNKMKNFYMKTLVQFRKRFCGRVLAKRFEHWREVTGQLKNNLLVSSAQNMNTKVKGLLLNRLKSYFDKLVSSLGYKKKITKHQIALGILVNLYFNRDLYIMGQNFRKWNKKAISGEVGELKAHLISRIMTSLLKKNDGLKNIGKLNVYFSKWKNVTERDLEHISNLNKLIKRYLLSSRFHDKMIRGNIDDLLEVATHINHLRKKQALKIGDFMGAVLAIYRRVNIMKRQKALHEALRRMNFYEKMQIMTASKRWLNKTAVVSANDKATVLQDFMRKLYQHKNQKAVVAQKAVEGLDNFTKRFVFFKMSEAARLNKLVSIIMKVFTYIPKELRKNYLRRTCSEWRQTSQIIKKNLASDMILKYLKGYIARRFVYKLKLKKHMLTEIVRRGLKRFIDEKHYYMTEWARNAKILSLKYNSLIIGTWIPQKFGAFKKMKAFRLLSELLKKKEFNYIVGTMKTLGKTTRLVDAVNDVSYRKNAIPLMRGLKQKYFRKKYSSVFGELTYKLRFCSVQYYADKWRNRVMDLQNLALIKIQAWVRMALQRLKAKRALRRNRLMLHFLLQIHWDAKIAKQGYINLWRETIKYADLDREVNILIRFIKKRNENMDYEKEIANMHLRKLFDKYLVTNIKYALVDCRNYKDSVVDVLTNLDSKIEKRYAVNNLIDFGKDTLRNKFIAILTGKQDVLSNHSLIRQAVEKWRFYNSRLLYFVLKLQRMRRGKVFRDFFKKSQKIYDLFVLLTVKYLGDKPLKTVRISQWLNKTRFFANQEKAGVIQRFLNEHLTGAKTKRLQDLFNNGFRAHFISCIGQVSKFKQLKKSLTKPLNVIAMQAIRRRFIFLKIRDMLTGLMGDATEDNKKMYKEEIIKRWRKQIIKINEHEKFSALLIVASIKAKLIKLRMKRWQELALRVKYLIYSAFGGEAGVKRCFVLQWLSNAKRRALDDSREALVSHAKTVLTKIKRSEHDNKTNKIGDGVESVVGTVKRHIGRGLLQRIKHRNCNRRLQRIDDIYVNKYKSNLAEALKKIKLYGVYRMNLIKRVQKYWRVKYKLWRFMTRLQMMRQAMKYAADKELAQKHAYIIQWRNIIRKANDRNFASVLQKFHRSILNSQLKKKDIRENEIQRIAKKLNLRNSVLDVFRKLKTLMHLRNIDHMVVRSHFNYFKFKSLILYILYILHGQFNKVEAKVKSTCVYKYRKIALRLRDREACSTIVRAVREVNRRRHDNKIRDVLVRIALGRDCDENEVKLRCVAQWCRNSFMLKTQEKVKVIEQFIVKKKRAYDLAKKWQRLGLLVEGKNGIVTSRLIFERIRMLRKTEPLVRFVLRHNIGKNGKDLLDGIKHKLIILFIRRALANSCGIADAYKLKEHAKFWRLKCWKLQNREKIFESASNNLQLKFLERGFRAIVGAYDFKRYSGLAKLAIKFDAIKRLRAKAKSMVNISKFADTLVKAQEYHIDLGSETFRDKVYKFYVYKLLANMGAIFLKLRDREHKPALIKNFFEKLFNKSSEKSATKYKSEKVKVQRTPKTFRSEAQHVQVSTAEKKKIELLGKEGKDHFAKSLGIFLPLFQRMANGRKQELVDKMLMLSLLGKLKRAVQNQKKTLFDKLSETVKNSVARANTFVLFRKIYLNKKLKEVESANKYLIMNHLMKLATITSANVTSRYMLRYFRLWRFNYQSGKIRDQKLALIKSSIDKFANQIKDDLFTGNNSIFNTFNKFNENNGLYDNPRQSLIKKTTVQAKENFMHQKSIFNQPSLNRANSIVANSKNPNLHKDRSPMRDTLGYALAAKEEAKRKYNTYIIEGNFFVFLDKLYKYLKKLVIFIFREICFHYVV